ncbi:hypothetical protein [Amycolatopsis anabasis]|uniref:hypothetical protein n=1 Tax=Amycolatopsis anabasis TaxID=1840409 RepID=UPI00131D6DB3|nr:hypothetical protein [Amycolatopsis anabasis]
MARTICALYLEDVLDNEEVLISNARRALGGVDFDTMIGTGLSGSLVVPVIARALGKHWAIVRKPNDGSHSNKPLEGTVGDRWVFVDDFVESGATRNRVIDVIEDAQEHYRFETEHVGSYLYSTCGGVSPSRFEHVEDYTR